MTPERSLMLARRGAIVLGLVIVAWQLANLAGGTGLHPFLIPDLVVAAALIAGGLDRSERRSAATLLGAFAATAGVFLAAVSTAVIAGSFGPGPAAAAMGLVPCLLALPLLARSLAGP